MLVVGERLRNAESAHDDKRDVVYHAGPIGISSCVRRPRAAPFLHCRVNHEPTPLHFNTKSIDFQAVRPSGGRVGALKKDEGRRMQHGLVLG